MITGMCASHYHVGCEFQGECSCVCHRDDFVPGDELWQNQAEEEQ